MLCLLNNSGSAPVLALRSHFRHFMKQHVKLPPIHNLGEVNTVCLTEELSSRRPSRGFLISEPRIASNWKLTISSCVVLFGLWCFIFSVLLENSLLGSRAPIFFLVILSALLVIAHRLFGQSCSDRIYTSLCIPCVRSL